MAIRLEIIDYFDSLINDVDLKAEKLLTQIPERYADYINNKRKLFLDEIEQIKQYNLSNLNETEKSSSKQDLLFEKYCFILDMEKMNGHRVISDEKAQFYRKRLDSIDAEQLFAEIIDSTFGILIILDEYLPDRKLILFKELLHFHERYFPYQNDDGWSIKEVDHLRVSSILNPQINYFPFDREQESQIFNSDYHDLRELYSSIWLQYDIFKQPKGFIIKTSREELFKLNYLYVNNVALDSISDEALELFGGRLSLFIYVKPDNIDVFYDCLNFIKWFESRLNVKLVNISLEDYLNNNVELSNFGNIRNLNELIINSNRTSVDGESSDRKSICASKVGELSSLKTLKLYSDPTNKIVHVDMDTFRSLVNLEQLCVVNFRNMNLQPDLFTGLSNLNELNLTKNGISSIGPRTFKDLINLRRLDLSSNCIEKIDPDALYGLANLNKLDLYGNKINSLVFLKHLNGLTDLILSFNKIKELTRGPFERLMHLEKLALDNNKIGRVDDTAFSSTPSLKILNLSFNNVIQISEHAFDKLNRLEELYLSFCSLENLNQLCLQGLVNLNKIDLDRNGIDQMVSGVFGCLPKLKSINLNYNKINHIDEQTLESLTDLRLTGNNLKTVDENSFRQLTNLTRLSFNYERIESSNLFVNLIKLVDLDLSSSAIGQIQPEMYAKLLNLKCLNLDNNKIDSLPVKMFSSLGQLERLSIRRNQIQLVDERAFEGLTNLRDLWLNQNKINLIPDNTFNALTNLQNLSLNYNKIEKLDFLNTQSLNNLKHLLLNYNIIVKIYSNCFSCLFTLVSLSLHSNRIENIDPDSFSNLINIREIDLIGNKMESVNCAIISQLTHLNYFKTSKNVKKLNSELLKNLQYLRNFE